MVTIETEIEIILMNLINKYVNLSLQTEDKDLIKLYDHKIEVIERVRIEEIK